MRRLAWLAGALALALVAPLQAFAATEPKTDPTKEFLLEPWIEIPKIGPIDLSITKAVFYLILSTTILLVGSLLVVRHLRLHPKRLQAFVEIVYDFSETRRSNCERISRGTIRILIGPPTGGNQLLK